MIRKLYSNLSTFKTIEFKSGMNVLLAEKSPGASDRQTRNGAGKTSLVELIHFLLGGNSEAGSIFKDDELRDFVFGLSFVLGDGMTSVERSGQKPSNIAVRTESSDVTLHTLRSFDWDGEFISNTNWRRTLGSVMFGLKGDQDEVGATRFGPTFRSLFPYFARRQAGGGFSSPFKTNGQQQLSDSQVAVSFLLGLDWTISQQWQLVREREKALRTLKTEAAKGTFGSMIGTTADLRTQLTVSEDRARRLRENVQGFRVLPEYRALEAEASQITVRLGELADENTIDLQLIAELEESFQGEKPPAEIDLERLYREAGVLLPESVSRRFEDVRRFHESIVQNRASYLADELAAARRRVDQREGEKKRLGDRYSEVMGILKSHGALDQFMRLQGELSRLEAQTESIRERFNAAEQLQGEKTELDIERDRLLLRVRQDFREQEEAIKHAIVAFEELSSSLYEEAGSLTIDATKNGPQFEVRIHGEKSKGISSMQVFCFDMSIMRICSERGIGPGFLIHDSHLFDGVDERQVGKALQLGAMTAKNYGFQYIVTLNSDAAPRDLPRDFSLDDFVLPVRLTDATEDGGLFGIRFG